MSPYHWFEKLNFPLHNFRLRILLVATVTQPSSFLMDKMYNLQFLARAETFQYQNPLCANREHRERIEGRS